MSELLDSAVAQMLAAFGIRVAPERVEAFTVAVLDEPMCERCAARACKNLASSMKRVPFPVHLVEEAREVQGTAEHARHIAEGRQLSAGDLGAWWATDAPVLVRKAWPELSSERAIAVARKLESFGYVQPRAESIAAELGRADKQGATSERAWWYALMPELAPSGREDFTQRAIPEQDR